MTFNIVGFDAAKRVLQLRQIRIKMKEAKDKFKKEMEPFEKVENLLEGELMQFLLTTNQQNSKTPNGTFYKIQKLSYSQENPDEFRRHIIGTESWDLADWRVNKTATDAFRLLHGGKMNGEVLEGGDLPPGVKKSEEITLGVLAPPKPKTTVATAVQPAQVTNDRQVETL